MNASPIDHARDLAARGFSTIPVPFKQKGPRIRDWQHLRIKPDQLGEHFNGRAMNVGILLGAASSWLIDIDLDCPEAVAMAAEHLPPTGAIFGRESRPRSHWVYRVRAPIGTTKWASSSAGMLLELRSTGCQTIGPGSTHPSGEAVRWDSDGEPALVDPADLLRACESLARAVRAELGEPDPEPPPEPRERPRLAGTAGTSAYGRRALDAEAERLARTPKGARNDAAFKAAAALGELVGGGEIDRAEAEAALLDAAAACGLPHAEAERAIRGGLDRGEQSPRSAPAAENAIRSPKGVGANETNPRAVDAAKCVSFALESGANETNPKPPNPTPRPVRIITIDALPPAAEPDWLWPGFIARGGITLLSALPKAGKSTLFAHLLRDMARGGPLVGEPIDAPTLILSEEPSFIWADRREALGLPDRTLIVQRDSFAKPSPAEWIDTISTMADAIRSEGVGLVAIDTLGSLWPCQDENDSSSTLAALAPIRELSEAGAGVLLIHHSRKSEGANGTSHRGSNAIAGFPDAIADLRFYDPNTDGDRRRIIAARGRFPGIPGESVLELTDAGYVIIGGIADAKAVDVEQTILDRLPADGSGITADQLHDDWPSKPKPGRTSLRGKLNYGATRGKWERLGTGTKGDPHRFRLNGEPDERPAMTDEPEPDLYAGLPI